MPNTHVITRRTQFRGLNNVSVPERLTADWAVKAENVDLTDERSYRQRRGLVEMTGTPFRILMTPNSEAQLYGVEGDTLYRIYEDFTTEVLFTGLGENVRWASLNEQIYVVDGRNALVIERGTVRDWGLEIPWAPTTTIVPGTLPAGEYRLHATYVAADGRESGASPAIIRRLQANQAFFFSQLSPPSGGRTRIYVTTPDGQVAYRALETADVNAQWDGGVEALSVPLRTLNLYPPTIVAPEQVAEYRGRMYIGQYLPGDDASVIFASEALNFELFRIDTEFFMVPGEIHMLLGTSQGLLVGTGLAVHRYDSEAGLASVVDYGVPPGMPGTEEYDGTIVVWTNRGLVVSTGSGFENVTEQAVSFPPGTRATTAVVDQDGNRKALVVTQEGGDPYNRREA